MPKKAFISPIRATAFPRLLSNGEVLMSKPTEDANHDLGKDIAEAVGKTIGNIVNRIEALDKERADLVATLEDTREKLNAQFNKWLPKALDTVGDKAKAAARRINEKPCVVCGFRTDPSHDARLKAHRDQGDQKTALTDDQLSAAGLRRV